MDAPFHELSEREKRQIADELMMPSGVTGALLLAAFLLLGLLWGAPMLMQPASSAGPLAAHVAAGPSGVTRPGS